jgi:MFS family permease
MEVQSNPSLINEAEVPPTQGALPVWIKVFTKPGDRTFEEILVHPEANAKSAYIWIFLVGTLSGLVSGLVQFLGTFIGLRQLAPELGEVSGFSGIFGTAGLVGALCGALIAGAFSLLGFIIGVAIIHGSAKFLGGQGTYNQMAYSFGAIIAPLTLISTLLLPFNLIPYVALCIAPLFLLLGLYALYLEIAAIKASHRFGWGGSAAALFMPTILIGMLCGIAFLGLLRIAGPGLSEIFQQLQQVQPGIQ